MGNCLINEQTIIRPMKINGWIACCWLLLCAIQLHAQQLVWEKIDFLHHPTTEKNLSSTLACTVIPDAGPDITVCPGSFPVQLNGSISGNYSSFIWSPIANISDPSILNPTVSGPGTYTLTTQGLGANLVTNGDFEMGDTGFDTDYSVGGSSPGGSYVVSDSPTDLQIFFSDCMDHTSGTGNMMSIDGATLPGNDMWCQTINVTPNTNYQLSLWVTMIGGTNPPDFVFHVNGLDINPGAAIPLDACLWTEVLANWNSGTATTVEFCIGNDNYAGYGNDFAIDDIGFYEFCENTDQVVVSELTIDVDIAASSIDCADDCVTLDASNSSQGTGYTYAWTASNGGAISTGVSTLSPEVCGAGTYQLVVTYDMNGMICSDSASISITNQNDLPIVPTFMGPDVVCEGDTVNYFITSNNPPTDGLVWTISGGDNLTGQSTSIDVEWSATGTEICVYATNTCGDSDPTCLLITVNNLPDVPVITGDASICNTTVGTYTVPTDPSINSYTWTVPTGASISSGQNSESVEVDWGTTSGGQVCLEITNDCGPTSDCFDVTIGAIQSNVVEAQPTCNNSVGSATASGSDGVAPYSFVWDDGTMSDNITGLSAGTYYVTVSDVDGCTALDSAIITAPLAIDIDLASTPISCNDICDGTIDITVTGGTTPYTYAWTGSTATTPNLIYLCANTYEVTVTDANMCTATVEVMLDNPPAIIASLADDVIICAGEAATFTLQLAGVGPFDVTLSDGTILNNVNNGDIDSISPMMNTTLTITDIVDQGQVGCTGTIGNGISITVNAHPLSPMITGDDELCDGETITYCVTNDPNVTTWNWTIPSDATMTGQGTNCVDIDWTGSAGGQICLEAINDCDTEEACLDITVHPIPTATFIVDPIICVTDSTIVTYTGSASINAIYTWNFNGGNILSGSGAGPYEINWATAGTYNSTLTVEENGCSSTVETQSVQVDAEIPPVVINCTSTTSSITFEWDPVSGGDTYTAINVNGLPGAQIGNSYTVDNLVAGQWVSAEVTVSGTSVCGDVTTAITCVALACPSITVEVDTIAAICLDGNNLPFDLTANITGGDGTGTSTWAGDGITNTATGAFDPTIAGAGTHNITYTYEEDGCEFNDAVSITIYDLPTADFIADQIICITDSTIITYTGTASATATYTWDFDGGNILSGSGAGPYEIKWATAGSYNITLTVEENGCTSTSVMQAVQVDEEILPFTVTCSSTPTSVIFMWAAVAGATSYAVTDINAPAGTLNGTTYEVTGLSVGQEVIIEVTAEGMSACVNTTVIANCFASNCPTIIVEVDAVANICLDANAVPFDMTATVTDSDGTGVGTWSGDGITDITLGTFDPAVAGVGIHNIVYTFEEVNCTYVDSIDIIVTALPTADFTVDAVICETNFATITYIGTASATYTWDFDGGNIFSGSGAGPYEIEWATSGTYNIILTVEENGCTSSSNTQSIQVDAMIPDFVINCSSTPTSVTFTWSPVAGATSYSVADLNGLSGILTDTIYQVTGLSVGQEVMIEVTAEGTSVCDNTTIPASCSADNCPMITVDVDAVANMCLDNNVLAFDMVSTVTGSDGTGVGAWSGDGITDATLGTFDPTVAGVGTHTITYIFEEVNCTYTGITDITIFTVPTSDFTVDAVICETNFTTITYTGTATTSATYTWDFDGGNILSGSGAGPYEVEWIDTGSYNITLTVEENGCISSSNTQSIQVDAVIPDFTINCNSTTSSVIFSWDAVAGATSYSIVDINGPAGILVGTSYEVTGLSIGQSVMIEVTAEGTSVCGNTTIPATCSADNCPTVTVDVDAVANMCLDNNALAFDMVSTVTGSDGAGIGTWSGGGITETTLGTFDPTVAGVGTHTITYIFEEVNCTYTGTTDITIFAVPTSDFTVDAVICETNFTTITYTGTATTSATYTWDFDGGNILSGSGAGPYEIEWATSGIYNITLTVEENGCISNQGTQSVQVDAVIPEVMVDCNSTTNSVTFSWDAVAGADNYVVTDIDGPAGTLIGNTYEVIGLATGQAVTIEITAEGNSICGNTTVSVTCSADNCPTIDVAITPVADICLYPNTSTVQLENTVTGSDGSGSGAWLGDGVTNGVFDPFTAGVGAHNITYTFSELLCDFTETIIINVFEVPQIDAGANELLSCADPIITLNGSSSIVGNYIWTTDNGSFVSGQNTLNPEIDAPGTYTLTVESNSCITTDSLVVDEDTSFPVGDAGVQQTITCDVTCITLGGSGTSEGPQYNYLWTGPNGFISDEKNPEVCVGGEYILTVSHNQFNCEAAPSSVMILENNTLPQVDILSFGNLDCITTAILLDGSTSSTGTEFSYQWYDANGMINDATTPIYEVLVEGDYTLMITNNTSGCTASSSAQVDDLVAYPNVVIEQPEILTCGVPMISLNGTGSTNLPQVNYLWTGPNGGIASGETTATPQITLPGVYTLTLIDATNGCETSETITVNQNIDAPVANAGDDIDLDCNDYNALIGNNNTSTGSIFTYSWTSDNPNASFNDATVAEPVVVGLGTFTLTVTNTTNGCTATDEMTILQSTNIPTDVVYDVLKSRCYGDNDATIIVNEVIGGTGPYLYSVDESPYASSNVFNDLEPGDYSIIIQDANGCELSMTVPITEPEEVTIDLGENIYVELGDSLTLNPQLTGDISIIDWSPEDIFDNCMDGVNCFNPLFYPTGQISISATVMDENGCRDEDFVTIFVSKKRYVFIPNAFSPDGEDDPDNETFMIYTGKGVEKVNMFRVFTRWGELVHEASDFAAGDTKDGWDGYFKGKMMNPGVYVYLAEIEFTDGSKEIYRGDVTLMR